MNTAAQLALDWTEQGRLPDSLVRAGIRRLLRARLRENQVDRCEAISASQREIVAQMDCAPIALMPDKANEQHYEVPAAFFSSVLGPHLKYSGCVWPDGVTDLAQAEESALHATCERAEIMDGHTVLDLGCGWGSLSLWVAHQYPASRITAVSNSSSQCKFVRDQARQRGLLNIDVVTCDMNQFQAEQTYDRVVSVEMLEHMRNWRSLFQKISEWLSPSGKFFMHIFCHRTTPYLFLDNGPQDWMSRYFFTGGMMPSDDLPLWFQQHLHLADRWRWNGVHYQRTAEAWLANMDNERERIRPVLEATYGRQRAGLWLMRWRMFFMACAELFGYDDGEQWWVSHYLFERDGS